MFYNICLFTDNLDVYILHWCLTLQSGNLPHCLRCFIVGATECYVLLFSHTTGLTILPIYCRLRAFSFMYLIIESLHNIMLASII